MATEPRQPDEDLHPLRALLVRLLLEEAAPGDPRLDQLITAMEQVIQIARDHLEGPWRQDLAALKTDLGKVRQAVGDAPPSAVLPAIKQMLAQSDAELTALLEAAEKRAHELAGLVSQLTDRVAQLEAQVQKLSAGRS
jgi:hypothetical protein